MVGQNKRRARYTWHAETVRALRQHLGVTQRQLAEDLGTRQQTISEWETGMYQPRGTSRTLLTIVAERSAFSYDAGGQDMPAPEDGEALRSRNQGKAL